MGKHPDDALPGLALLFVQCTAQVRERDQPERIPFLADDAASEFPPARPAGKRQLHGARRSAGQLAGETQLLRCPAPEAVRRLPEQSLAGAIDDAQHALRVEGQHHDVDLLQDLAERLRGLDGPEPLLLQDLLERVDLEVRQRDGVPGITHSGPDREVPLTEGREHVRDGLERPERMVLRRGAEPEPGGDQRQRQRPPHCGVQAAPP